MKKGLLRAAVLAVMLGALSVSAIVNASGAEVKILSEEVGSHSSEKSPDDNSAEMNKSKEDPWKTKSRIDLEKLLFEISEQIPDFEKYTAKLYETSPGNGTIDLVRMIGEIETDSVFIAVVENNKITDLIDRTYPIDARKENELLDIISALDPDLAETQKNTARIKCEAQEKKTVKAQEDVFYYSCEEDKLYHVVATDYYYDNTAALGRDTEVFEIQ